MAADAVCRHEMVLGTCIDCAPRVPRRSRVGDFPPGGMFVARWDGWCRGCGQRIEAGEPIGYRDEEIHCADCLEYE